MSLLAAVWVGGAGCGPQSELDPPATLAKAGSGLEQAFDSAGERTRSNVQAAVRAMENLEYEQAYLALQLIQAEPDVTYPQAVATRQAMQTLQERLARGVVAGDPEALRAAEAIKRMQR